jgi:hypothetical protein
VVVLPGDMPIFYDSVTLQHAAAAGCLPILESIHGYRPEPRWTERVKSEVEAGARMIGSASWCQPVLDFEWLGPALGDEDVILTFELQALMNAPGDASDKNLGEAQCMSAAITRTGCLVTDDRRAYKFAARYPDLDKTRVMDFCQLLYVAAGEALITLSQVEVIHDRIESLGRTMLCARHDEWA